MPLSELVKGTEDVYNFRERVVNKKDDEWQFHMGI